MKYISNKLMYFGFIRIKMIYNGNLAWLKKYSEAENKR